MPSLLPARSNKPAPGGSRQAGVGLIEILVAILVLSIGLLGMAALQTKALSTNNGAMASSVATIASYSILDAMRADKANALTGSYNTTVTTNPCPTSRTSLAEAQLSDWCSQMKQNLGAASTTSGTINCSNTGTCTITIQYDNSRAGTQGQVGLNNQKIITSAML